MKVLEIMKTHVIKAEADATLCDVVDMMDLYQISGLPVVDGEDRLLGVVTEYDVIEALLKPYVGEPPSASPEAFAALVAQLRGRVVGEAMSRPAIAVDESDSVVDAAQLMLSRHVKRLPVTAGGRLVGILSRIDICQAILEGQLAAPAREAEEPRAGAKQEDTAP